MPRAEPDIILDEGQQAVFRQMSTVIDAVEDGIDLMTRTQDFIDMLLRRASDQPLREQTLGEVSRFFLGVMKAAELSPEYRIRRLRMFAKATVKLLVSTRPNLPRAAAG